MSQVPVPLDKRVIDEIIAEFGMQPANCSIRELCKIIDTIEERLGVRYIRMEFGIPGLKTDRAAIEAEIKALSEDGLSSRYPQFEGIPVLKKTAAEFVKKFLNVEVPVECCLPTIGAMQGGFIAQAVIGRISSEKNVILFLDPGFPVNKLQNRFLGLKSDSIDFYDKRGQELVEAVESRFKKGDVAGLMYSNPNNPTWITFTEEELKGFGRILNEYDGIAIEDLAYLGMDFEEEYEIPGKPPFPPTVARYTDNYILLISSSKIFSYAGQRIGLAILSPKLLNWESDALEPFFSTRNVAYAFIHGGLYCNTAGVPQGPQHGLMALLEKANSGDWSFLRELEEYKVRADFMKKAFLANGFRLAYDEAGRPLRDGFYFTYSYPDLDVEKLSVEQLYYGLSSLSLLRTGAHKSDGFRACVSQVGRDQFETLEYRLRRFHEDHE